MRFLPPSYARRLARAVGAVAVGAALAACSFITGVPSVDRVELTAPFTTIAPGQTVQASGVAYGGGGNVITHSRRQVRYSSSDDAVATVTAGGLITGVASGRATIRATSDDESDELEITVRPVPVRDLIIQQRSPVVRLAPAVVFQLTAAVIDTNNQPLANRPPTWRVLDETVATVNAVGLVTPRAVGTTQVVASVENGLAPALTTVADTVELRVTTPPVALVRLAPEIDVRATPGQTVQFTATVTDSTNVVVAGRVINWRSSNTSVATVNEATGLATAVAPGATAIIARLERVQGDPASGFAEAAVTLTVTPTPAASVSVTPNPINLRIGGTTQQTVNVVVRDAGGNQLFGRRVRVSGNDATVAVASTEATGGETTGTSIQVTARGGGSTTFTLQPLDQAGQPQGTPATLTVNVAP